MLRIHIALCIHNNNLKTSHSQVGMAPDQSVRNSGIYLVAFERQLWRFWCGKGEATCWHLRGFELGQKLGQTGDALFAYVSNEDKLVQCNKAPLVLFNKQTLIAGEDLTYEYCTVLQ